MEHSPAAVTAVAAVADVDDVDDAVVADVDVAAPTAPAAPAGELLCAGVDVSSRFLDVHVLGVPPLRTRLANGPGGAAELAGVLRSAGVGLVAVEATGGYERDAVDALLDAGVPVALVNPRQVRDFARALNLLEKTDAIDAAVIARFALALRPRTLSAGGADMAELRELVGRRRQLVEQCVANTNQLRRCRVEAVKASVRRTLDHLAGEVAAVEALIQAAVDADAYLTARFTAMCGVVGVGARTARVLVAELPELGAIDRRGLAKLVGVAPVANDSGDRAGGRTIRGGRATVRRALYMAAVTAARCNPVIAPYYQGLRARNKAKKQALVACMRKLVIHLNSLLAKIPKPA